MYQKFKKDISTIKTFENIFQNFNTVLGKVSVHNIAGYLWLRNEKACR